MLECEAHLAKPQIGGGGLPGPALSETLSWFKQLNYLLFGNFNVNTILQTIAMLGGTNWFGFVAVGVTSSLLQDGHVF